MQNVYNSIQNFNSHARVGRDKNRSKTFPGTANFNSHARVGRDGLFMAADLGRTISTHTPV